MFDTKKNTEQSNGKHNNNAEHFLSTTCRVQSQGSQKKLPKFLDLLLWLLMHHCDQHRDVKKTKPIRSSPFWLR